MKRGVFQPNKTRDIAGEKFGSLTAVRFDHRDERKVGGQHYWLFRCDCGNMEVKHDLVHRVGGPGLVLLANLPDGRRGRRKGGDEMSDYIKREDAIDAVCGWGPNDLTEAIRSDIETIPAADVRPRWIPVTERKPKTDDIVIVAIHDDSGDTPYDVTNVGYLDVFSLGIWVVENERCNYVTHWMPLPQPPKELTGTDMRGGIRWDEAGNVIDWGITGPPGDVGKTEEGE